MTVARDVATGRSQKWSLHSIWLTGGNPGIPGLGLLPQVPSRRVNRFTRTSHTAKVEALLRPGRSGSA